jgi:hypothetical protein
MSDGSSREAIDRAIDWGRFYRSLGFNSIPSCPILGHPPWRYGHARDVGLSEKSFERMVTRDLWTNIQIATGRKWGLVGLDVEGETAFNLLEGWQVWNTLPPTWTVRSPRGLHYWFYAPADSEPIGTRHLWQSKEPGAHDGVEIIGDASLLKAPPSGKVVDGVWREYRWLPGRSPADLPLATFPDWLRRIDHREQSVAKIPRRPLTGAYNASVVTRWGGDELPNWKDVLASIPDKVELARRLGLPLAKEKANASGWIAASCVFRPDRTPSASYSEKTGRWWEPGMGRNPITPFDLGVALGHYPDFATALMSIARDYGWKP